MKAMPDTWLLDDCERYIAALADFIHESPTSYHAVQAATSALRAAGFSEYAESAEWAALTPGSSGFVRRDGAVIAWRLGGEVTALSPVRMLGCHTDSPGLVLKPRADSSMLGWAQIGVEVYGGPLLATWFDRDLALAGRIVTREGREVLVRTPPVARIPTLAIHLDREAATTFSPDRQRHLQPVIGVGEVSVAQLLASTAGIDVAEIAGLDIRLADTQQAARIGASRELLAAGRLDNLSSLFAGLVALLEAPGDPGSISILAAFDHEEIGSETRSGAGGPMLTEVIGRLRSSLGATADEAARAMAASWCLSADAGHAVHPNYAERHDPNVRPQAGAGPMLKVNANQRYATDAHGAALWNRCCEAAGVPSQVFVSNNSVPCGSTIGPITAARLGIRTVDAGVPLLSMHSVRELGHVDDLHGLARVISAFFAAG